MPRNAEARLARLEKRQEWDHSVQYYRVDRHRIILAMCAEIYRAAIDAGVDPADTPVWRVGEKAAKELEALGEPFDMPEVDERTIKEKDRLWHQRHPGEPCPRVKFFAKLDSIGRQFADGGTPSQQDPLLTWYGWARAVLTKAKADAAR